MSDVEVEVAVNHDGATNGPANQAAVGASPQLGREQVANAARSEHGTLHGNFPTISLVCRSLNVESDTKPNNGTTRTRGTGKHVCQS